MYKEQFVHLLLAIWQTDNSELWLEFVPVMVLS
jgi:hypothetical protein